MKTEKISQYRIISLRLVSIAVAGYLLHGMYFFLQDTRLWFAVNGGDIAKATNLLNEGVDPNKSYWQAAPAIGIAAYEGNLPMVELLVRHGANPKLGLQSAAMMGRLSVCHFLVQSGALLTRDDRKNAVATAKEENHLDVVAYLESVKTRH